MNKMQSSQTVQTVKRVLNISTTDAFLICKPLSNFNKRASFSNIFGKAVKLADFLTSKTKRQRSKSVDNRRNSLLKRKTQQQQNCRSKGSNKIPCCCLCCIKTVMAS